MPHLERLRPCQYCAAELSLVDEVEGEVTGHQVICADPECLAAGPIRRTPDAATEAWNDGNAPRAGGLTYNEPPTHPALVVAVLLIVVLAILSTLTGCCTTALVRDPESGALVEETDCLSPAEMAAVPLVWLVFGFN